MSTPKKRNNSWHGTVYSHTNEDGKRIYQSITADTKAEWYALEKEFKARKTLGEKKKEKISFSVGDIVDRYIVLKSILSPTTLDAYKRIRKYAFPELMIMKVSDLTKIKVQEEINKECSRLTERTGKPLSAKTIKNEWFLVASALKEIEGIQFRVKLPTVPKPIVELPEPDVVFRAVKGTDIELPCVLAMWLSLSMSEVRGLTWQSIRGGKLHIDKVMVNTTSGAVLKDYPKAEKRTRALAIPPYIADLLSKTPRESEFVVPMSARQIDSRLRKLGEANGFSLSFHKLRHINASVMAMLSIPTQYAQERGGWKTPHTMQGVYQHTFSKERQTVDNIVDNFFEDMIKSCV